MVPTILKYELMKRGIRPMLKEYSRNVIFRANSKQNVFKVATQYNPKQLCARLNDLQNKKIHVLVHARIKCNLL